MARADVINKFIKYIEDAVTARPEVKDNLLVQMDRETPEAFEARRTIPAVKGEHQDLDLRRMRMNALSGNPPKMARMLEETVTPSQIEYEALMDATRRYLADGNEPLNPDAARRTVELAQGIRSGSVNAETPASAFYGVDVPYLRQIMSDTYDMSPQAVRDRYAEMGYQVDPGTPGRPQFTIDGMETAPFYRSVASREADPRFPAHTSRLYDAAVNQGKPVNVFATDNPDVARTYLRSGDRDTMLQDDAMFSTAYGVNANDLDLLEGLGVSQISNYGKEIEGLAPGYTMPIFAPRQRVHYDAFDAIDEPILWNRLPYQTLRDSDGNPMFNTPEFYGLTPEGYARAMASEPGSRPSSRTSELLGRINRFSRNQYGMEYPVEFHKIYDIGGQLPRGRMADYEDPDNLVNRHYTGSNILAGTSRNLRTPLGLALPELRGAPWIMGAAAGAAYGLPYAMTEPTQ